MAVQTVLQLQPLLKKGVGRRMAFGSNGIYVGGKDTFISELSGNWAVHGELAAISVTGAPGPVGRITVELGSAPPSSLAKYATRHHRGHNMTACLPGCSRCHLQYMTADKLRACGYAVFQCVTAMF